MMGGSDSGREGEGGVNRGLRRRERVNERLSLLCADLLQGT